MAVRASLTALGLVLAGAASASENRPLSVIDWINELDSAPIVQAPAPDVVPGVQTPDVTVTPLSEDAPRRVGLVPPEITGLPESLWSVSSGKSLARAIRGLPDRQLPAAQALNYTVLLAEADPPLQDAEDFNRARVEALIRYGALDPALALLDQLGPERSAGYFALYLDASLLNGTPGKACAILTAQPALSPSQEARIYCLARSGDWDTAALLLGSADAIGAIDATSAEALGRFLDPDLFEEAAPMVPPEDVTPLMFRLFEAAGQRLPTAKLPRAFAHADLDGSAGWKAQIEAAERLARSGAMPANRLIGIYSDRRPAASGGVWDRVRAVQLFDTALATGSADAVRKTLPQAWAQMQAVGLSVPFAQFYAEDIPARRLAGPAADAAYRALLLSAGYEDARIALPDRARALPVLDAVARGEQSDFASLPSVQQAISDAFAPEVEGDVAVVKLAQRGALGLSILQILVILQDGAAGDAARLERALASLRALGLENTARSAALQILVDGAAR